jgi:hypothetical protein
MMPPIGPAGCHRWQTPQAKRKDDIAAGAKQINCSIVKEHPRDESKPPRCPMLIRYSCLTAAIRPKPQWRPAPIVSGPGTS